MYNYNFKIESDFGNIISDFGEIMPILVIIFSIMFSIMAIILIALYIFNAIGLYRMAKNRNMPNAWMAWIPILNTYLMGNVACPMNFGGKMRKNFGPVLLVLKIAVYIITAFVIFVMMDILCNILNADIGMYGGADGPTSVFVTANLIAIIPLVLILSAIGIVYSIFTYIAYYHLFSHYDKKSAVIYTVLSVIVSGIAPIFIFVLRNRQFVNHYNNTGNINNMQNMNKNNFNPQNMYQNNLNSNSEGEMQ